MTTTPSVEVRRATQDDVPALTQLVNAAYRGDGWTGEKDLIKGERISETELSKQINEGKFFIYLAELAADEPELGNSKGQLAGCYAVKPWQQDEAEIGMLSVAPTMQSRGLGTTLVNSSYRYAKSEFNAKRAVVTVINVRAELLRWYRKLGYVETGEKIQKPGVDPLVENFHFVVLKKEIEK